MSIEVSRIRKTFGGFVALNDVSYRFPTGELVALLGPSGSGKTTLLRIIAGLDFADFGEVKLDGAEAANQKARERKVGFVFQHYALFRHMTVFENVAFGLRVKPRQDRLPDEKIRKKVNDLLELVQLDWLAPRYPAQLSGGQRQRVALARALSVDPKVLLLDEPFGSLDAKVRKELRTWLRSLHDELHITSIFVTHDQEEALDVADRVVIMNEGSIVQSGSPAEVYNKPATPFVYNFLGDANRLKGFWSRGRVEVAGAVIETPDHVWKEGEKLLGFTRPHLMMIHRKNVAPVCIPAVIKRIHAVGPLVQVDLVAKSGEPLVCKISHARYETLQLKEGEDVFITPGEVKFFSDAHRPTTEQHFDKDQGAAI
jgi:sulfate transport system ATP-binding protein